MSLPPVALTRSTQAILLSQQTLRASAAEASEQLASGLKVRSALDGANYHTAKSLTGRADALNGVMDGISLAMRQIEAADSAALAIGKLVDEIERVLLDAAQETVVPGADTPPPDAIDAGATTLISATGVTAATDLRDIGFSPNDDGYVYVWAGNETPSVHRFLEDGWTVGDLVNTINTEDDGVTASIVDGSLVLASEVGGVARVGTGTVATTAGLEGQIFNLDQFYGDVNLVEGYIAGQTAAATFTATTLDYPNGGGDDKSNQRLGAYLGVDAGTLTGLATNTQVTRMAFEMEGYLNVTTSGSYNFTIGSDDGAKLEIDGNTVLVTDNSGGSSVNVSLDAGLHTIRILSWENNGTQGLWVESPLTGGAALGGGTLATPGTFDPSSLVIPPAPVVTEPPNEYSLRFDALSEQIEDLAFDAGTNTGNTALGEEIDVHLDERGVTLGVSFGSIDMAGLGLTDISPNDWLGEREMIEAKIEAAREALQRHAIERQGALGILKTRETFNDTVIDTLESGAATLTLADPSEEGANLLAIQTRQQLAAAALARSEGDGLWIGQASRRLLDRRA